MTCGDGFQGAVIDENDVAIGAGDTTDPNNRWRCVPNPIDPTQGMYTLCQGCVLTVIPDSIRNAQQYREERQAHIDEVNKMAQEIYACSTNSTCKNTVYSNYGVTGESAAYQALTKEQVNAEVKLYEGQDNYFAAREKYNLCAQQQAMMQIVPDIYSRRTTPRLQQV